MKRQIFECSNNIIAFKQSSPDDVSFLSDSISTIKTFKKTDVIENEVKQSLGSVRDAYEYICHPMIFSRLKVGQCVLVRHNPKEIDVINLNYFDEDKIFNEAVAELNQKGVANKERKLVVPKISNHEAMANNLIKENKSKIELWEKS
jgi:hypothetical protein